MIHDPDARLLGTLPGLPDETFCHDGLITKRLLRAAALAHLRPAPGELLWDVGTGAGSIAIEWCRAAENARAIGLERQPERAERARANATRLTQPGAVTVLLGEVDELIIDLPAPAAVFVGGGGTWPVLETAWAALPTGGRLVVHGITVPAETLCSQAHERWGGVLSRIAIETAEPLGSLTGFKPARTLIQWAGVR